MEITVHGTAPKFAPFSVTLNFQSEHDVEEWKKKLGSPYNYPWNDIKEDENYGNPINKLNQAIKFQRTKN